MRVFRTLVLIIRKFFLRKDRFDPKPGRLGIALRPPEWTKLKESIVYLHETMPALAQTLPYSYIRI